MNIEKKFPVELLNTDAAAHVISENAAVNMRNIRVHKSIDGKQGYFENIMQNLKVSGQDGKIPAGSERIASWEDPAGRYAIWFTHKEGSSNDDQINLYDFNTGKYWLVARNNMGVNGEIAGGLGFKRGYFYDLEFANGILYWTGEDHQPRKLDIGAGIKACDPLAAEDSPFYKGWRYDWVNTGDDDTSNKNLSLAAKPPAYPPMISKRVDTTIGVNNLTGESYQFFTQFVYKTNEQSTLSTFSISSLVNSDEDKDKNVIDVTINPLEAPYPQGLKEMRLFVKVASTQKAYLVKTWTAEEVLSGSLLIYSFFGNYFGIPLSSAVLNEPFHSVPRMAETIQLIKNRLMLGNCLEGYNTPKTTSMELSLGPAITIEDLTSQRVKIQYVMYRGTHKKGLSRPRFYYSGLYVKLDSVPTPGYYLIPGTEIRYSSGFSGIPAVFASVPATVLLGDLVFKGRNLDEIIEATRSWAIARIYESYIRESPSVTIEVDGLLDSGAIRAINVFLHKADYIAGNVFFDRWLQKCSVITKSGLRISIPVRNFALTTAYNDIKYSFSNDNAVDEIPEWAEYYAPLLARNSRTSFFLTGFSSVTRYARIDPETSEYKYDDGKEDTDPGNDDAPYLTYSDATVAIGVDTTSLINAGLGYTFNQGDICILIGDDDTVYYLPVIGQDGKYIRLAARDIGSLVDKEFIYEIYTPFKGDEQDFFYEIGQLYPVSEPGTANRKYSTISGSFLPDVFIVGRRNGIDSAYQAYAMSPNDLFWKRWDNHFGRANKVLDIGESKKTGNISYGDVFTPGTGVNGLNAFHAINETNNLGAELGAIKKLQRTSKVQGEGDVLLVICEAGVASVYIGESEILDQSGNSVLAKSSNVIGQINPLKGGFGTTHPESVKEIDGQVFWWSQNRKSFARYDSNGIFPISNYGFESASYKLSVQIESEESQGKRVMVNSGVDHFFKEYLIQKKAYNEPGSGFCGIAKQLVVTLSPTEDNPERVLVTWDNPNSNTLFSWTLFDQNGFPVQSNPNFAPSGPTATVELLGLITGIDYTFQLIVKCSPSNLSDPISAIVLVPGVTPPPQSDCVKPSYDDVLIPAFVAEIGVPFHAEIEFGGTMPFSLSEIVKPSFLSLTLSGRRVILDGLPTLDSFGTVGASVPISFRISNCAPESYVFSTTITPSFA